MKVFLGGTCNGSKWRQRLIPMLKIDYFDPVVVDWTEECMAEEIRQRELCDICLYVITPMMMGVYSIAEAIDDSNKRPEKTVFAILDTDCDSSGITVARFTTPQLKSLRQVGKMVESNGGEFHESLDSVAESVNIRIRTDE